MTKTKQKTEIFSKTFARVAAKQMKQKMKFTRLHEKLLLENIV